MGGGLLERFLSLQRDFLQGLLYTILPQCLNMFESMINYYYDFF